MVCAMVVLSVSVVLFPLRHPLINLLIRWKQAVMWWHCITTSSLHGGTTDTDSTPTTIAPLITCCINNIWLHLVSMYHIFVANLIMTQRDMKTDHIQNITSQQSTDKSQFHNFHTDRGGGGQAATPTAHSSSSSSPQPPTLCWPPAWYDGNINTGLELVLMSLSIKINSNRMK